MLEAVRWLPVRLSLRVLRRTLLLLLTALVLVQTIGVLHRVVHAKIGAQTVVVHPPSGTEGLLSWMWGEHENSTDCQLFDQACPDLLHTPILTPPPSRPLEIWLVVTPIDGLIFLAQFYAARGPPVLH